MRVIAGKYKSRILKDPKGHKTHPMSERIRGALFNSLGDITGKTFLDAFSGTGAVAVEALSRGAVGVHAVEKDNDAFEVLKHNRDLITDSSEVDIHRANVKSWIRNYDQKFDLIVADPPYDKVSMDALDVIAEYVEDKGILIVSLPVAENYRNEKLKLLDEKKYGNAKLAFYKHK